MKKDLTLQAGSRLLASGFWPAETPGARSPKPGVISC